jgi:hypothetical protein
MEKTTITITFESQKPLTGEFSPMANLIDDVKNFTKKAKQQGVDIKYQMTEKIQ